MEACTSFHILESEVAFYGVTPNQRSFLTCGYTRKKKQTPQKSKPSQVKRPRGKQANQGIAALRLSTVESNGRWEFMGLPEGCEGGAILALGHRTPRLRRPTP